MLSKLREAVRNEFEGSVNSAKDCELLRTKVERKTERRISSTTLRRFFSLLTSKTSLSRYNLDTLAMFCGYIDYDNFCEKGIIHSSTDGTEINRILNEAAKITRYTIRSISLKSLLKFELTIPREDLNLRLSNFLKSEQLIFPVIAPGGFGKSIALAHWVEKLNISELHVLFCQASVYFQLAVRENRSQSLVLNPISEENVFEQFLRTGLKDRFLIIIDSLDELSSDSQKTHDLIATAIKTLNRYSDRINLKIIISSREDTWSAAGNLDLKHFLRNLSTINNTESLNSIGLLTDKEIREIIENHNRISNTQVLFELFSWDLRDLLSQPINLTYFLRLAADNKLLHNLTPNKLRKEHLQETIFNSTFAEQKEDIVWKVLDLIESKEDDFFINKDDLKLCFPVHLKRESEYYKAYHQLIKDSLLIEEREEICYGLYFTKVGFTHQNIYFYLCALSLIRRNKELNKELFTLLGNHIKSLNWVAPITAILFEIAYEEGNLEALEDFCELPDTIISSMHVRFAVGTSFRRENCIRERLIKLFAESKKGQIYFFEEFVDTNYLFNNYTKRIEEYLRNKSGLEATLFGNCILFLAGFLGMDKTACHNYHRIINRIQPDSSIHPWPIGRKVAYEILYRRFIEQEEMPYLMSYLGKYKKIAYDYKSYLEFGLIAFELPIIVSLVLVQEYRVLISFLEDTLHQYNSENPKDPYFSLISENQNNLPVIFLEFARFRLGIYRNDDFPLIMEGAINKFVTAYDDFQYQILLKIFLFLYYNEMKNPTQAMKFYSSALELSKNAEYDFYTALLLNNHPEGDYKAKNIAKEMIEKSGFNSKLFQFCPLK